MRLLRECPEGGLTDFQRARSSIGVRGGPSGKRKGFQYHRFRPDSISMTPGRAHRVRSMLLFRNTQNVVILRIFLVIIYNGVWLRNIDPINLTRSGLIRRQNRLNPTHTYPQSRFLALQNGPQTTQSSYAQAGNPLPPLRILTR